PPAARPLATSDGTTAIQPDTMLTFALDSDQRDTAASSQIGGVAQWRKDHTDRTGTHAYNMDLSRGRAEAVRSALVANGVPAERIVIAMYGDRDAHSDVDETDRRAVIFASKRPIDSLAASMLSATKANQVEWTSKSGAQMKAQLNR